MPAPPNTTKTYYDSLSSFELGCNSGISPTLLPKNQLAWAINATVRGGFIKDRPPLERQTLNYNGDEALRAIVEFGYYQGGAIYRPDFGASQIIIQVNGHLVRLTENGDWWDVDDISIAGDLNSTSASVVWMWQSENYLIISDGTGALPIFYNGSTCRRSYGPSVVLTTTNAVGNFPNPRVIGEVVQVDLAVPFDGPWNVPVIFNGYLYQTVSSVVVNPQYEAIIENVTAPLGTLIPDGSNIIVSPSRIGTVDFASGSWWWNPTYNVWYCTFNTVQVITGYIDFIVAGNLYHRTCCVAPGPVWSNIFQASAVGYTDPTNPPPFAVPSAGDEILSASSTQPSVIVGVTIGDNNAPAIGAELAIFIDRNYPGPDDQPVWIGNYQYLLSSVPPPGPTLILNLINLNDTTDAGAAIPAEDILSVPELPAGRMGAYGMGRNWMCLADGISYIAGDIVGGASGTQASNYRDSVLKITENTFLIGGGTFRLPNAGNIITAMIFAANLDAALGQGPLQIGTDSGFFSNNSPPNREDWQDLTIPLQSQSLIGAGPLAQRSTIVANSDILYRNVDGIGSLVLARRDFSEIGAWGNAPISREIVRAFENDNISLLPYGSAITFDNRCLITCYPSVSKRGVFHQGLGVLNFDLVSNLRGKAPPVYDGLWTGLNLLQMMSGNFTGVNRSFAFGYNIEHDQIELYEMLRAKDGNFDNGDTRIAWEFETATLFREDIKPKSELIRLLDAEVEVQEVDNLVDIEVQYKPDYYPCWTSWRSFQVCADQTVDEGKPGYRTKLSLGDPPTENCEAYNNRPLNVGHFFQFKVKITGHCTFMGMRVQATSQPEADFAPPICSDVTSDTLPVP